VGRKLNPQNRVQDCGKAEVFPAPALHFPNRCHWTALKAKTHELPRQPLRVAPMFRVPRRYRDKLKLLSADQAASNADQFRSGALEAFASLVDDVGE
jgi:hypothetical protein